MRGDWRRFPRPAADKPRLGSHPDDRRGTFAVAVQPTRSAEPRWLPSWWASKEKVRPAMRRSGKRNAAVVSNRVSGHEGIPISDEICEDCGALVAEPNAPHTRRDCEKCGKQRFGTAGPEGVKTEPGDTFVIPAGFLTMSLDPTQSNGRLMRPGMTWLVREGFFANASEDADSVGSSLDAYEEQADRILKVSEVLKDIDLDSEEVSRKQSTASARMRPFPSFGPFDLGSSRVSVATT
jgi:hypothetical protein